MTTDTTKTCDHKFVDSKVCLKCGWAPPARETIGDPEEIVFWVQTERWTTTHRSMRADVLRHYVKMPANYSLRLLDSIDTIIHDNQTVDLTGEPRFIFIPPAHY